MAASRDLRGGALGDDAPARITRLRSHVEKLIQVLHRLVAAGNTAVVVEHNLDVMAEADWILDMGPEAGDAGGRIVAQGTPAQIARRRQQSHTGRVLEAFLRARTRPQPAGVT